MADKSKIEWTDASWTPIRARNLVTDKVGWHCEHVSPGCVNCYSERQNKSGARGGTRLPFKPGHRADINLFLDETMLTQPLRWKKPRVVFVCSMTDLFADFVPEAWIDRVFAVMALAPQHTFGVLTKRAKRMRLYCSDHAMPGRIQDVVDNMEPNGVWKFPGHEPWVMSGFPLPNVYLGVSAEDQERADERIPELMETPAAGRFVSLEPMLGPIDLNRIDVGAWMNSYRPQHVPSDNDPICKWPLLSPFEHMQSGYTSPGLKGVILGGESGPGARPMHPDWARGVRDQCAAASVPFFFKQWGEWAPAALIPREEAHRWPICPGEPSGGVWSYRVGKSRAGRLLDGIEHDDLAWSLAK